LPDTFRVAAPAGDQAMRDSRHDDITEQISGEDERVNKGLLCAS